MNEFRDKLKSILDKYEEVKETLNSQEEFDQKEFVRLSKEFAELSDLAKEIKLFFSKTKELEDALEIADSSEDKDLRSMAEEEIPELKKEIEKIENNIKILLLPKDIDDEKGAILEVRAGT